MKKAVESCYYHLDRMATNYCTLCGLPICPECINEIIIDGEQQIVCKECYKTFQLKPSTQKTLKSTDMMISNIKRRSIQFSFNFGTLVGLAIEFIILGLIAREIIRIVQGTNVSGWGDIGSIIVIAILAFIFWSIVIYGIKKFFRKAPKIVKITTSPAFEEKTPTNKNTDENLNTKYCFRCGHVLNINDNVCSYCGTRQPVLPQENE
ncbi:MAG: hypothetical protein ACTSYD_07280 [Candidatus Heimdallarchaeaceae archaeon]